MCQQVLDAIERLQDGTPGLLWMDGCDYPNIRLPHGWDKITGIEHRNIGAIMQQVYADHPNLPWYGWMSDDCIPLTACFDTTLVAEAGKWGLAYPDDAWLKGQRDDGSGLPNMTSIAVWGGETVRAAGFWSPPGMVQMCIDEAWARILHPIGLMRYMDTVKSVHKHFANGKREADATDTRMFKDQPFPVNDRAICEALDYPAIIARIKAAMR
jgi:hypothetical protein